MVWRKNIRLDCALVVLLLLSGCAQKSAENPSVEKPRKSTAKNSVVQEPVPEAKVEERKLSARYLAGYSTRPFPIKTKQDELAVSLCRKAISALKQDNENEARLLLKKAKDEASDSFITWYTIGFIEFGKGSYKEALLAFKKATTINGKDYDALDGLGRSYYRLKDFSHARQALELAVAVKPDYFLGHMNLGILAIDSGRAKEARVRLERAITLAPQESSPHYWLGYYYHGFKNYEQAASHYKKAVAIDKNEVRSMKMLATVYTKQHKFDKASKIFTELRDRYPKRFQYYDSLASIEESRGNWKSAISQYDLYNELNPESELGLVQQAHQYLNCRQYAQAEAKLKEALKRNPKSGDVYNGLGNCAINRYDFKEAARYHEIAVSYNPNSAVFWNNLGLDYMLLPDSLKDARRALERAYQLNPQGEVLLANLSNVYRKMGDVKKATVFAVKCLKVKPDSIKGLLALASVRVIEGKFDSAEKLASTAIGIDSESAEVWHMRGLAYFKQGKFKEAEKDWQKAVELHPRLHKAWRSLAELYEKTNDDKKKTAALKHAIKAKKGMTADDLYRDAFALEQLGEYHTSAGAFGEGLNMDPAEADVLLNLPIPQKSKDKKR